MLEQYRLVNEQLVATGMIARDREYGGSERLRVRLEYPDRFPLLEPRVYDHDHVFQPSAAGHQFPDFKLCLHFPERPEFTQDENALADEVLGAALNWMIKRNIFERNERHWPGEAEPHGYAEPYKRLALERAAQGKGFMLPWVEFALATGNQSRGGAPCPCLSGAPLGACHPELARLVDMAIICSRLENSSNGRR
jgi:hypothetical protein